MATIADAVRSGGLDEYDLPDWDVRSPVRSLYVSPGLFDWVDANDAIFDGSVKRGGRTPLEHLELFFNDLRCSPKLASTDFTRMMPTKFGVWEAHVPTLRVFGWVCAKATFVAVSAELESRLKKDKNLYEDNLALVLAFIKKHGLGDHVLNGDHRAVFS